MRPAGGNGAAPGGLQDHDQGRAGGQSVIGAKLSVSIAVDHSLAIQDSHIFIIPVSALHIDEGAGIAAGHAQPVGRGHHRLDPQNGGQSKRYDTPPNLMFHLKFFLLFGLQ